MSDPQIDLGARHHKYVSRTVYAPWTAEVVAALNAYQGAGHFHQYTCDNRDECGPIALVATTNGWQCPACNWTQPWAWRWALDIGRVQQLGRKDK